jgi:hypothetical protein
VSIARMVHAGSATDAVLNHGVDRRNDSGIQVDGSNEPRLVRSEALESREASGKQASKSSHDNESQGITHPASTFVIFDDCLGVGGPDSPCLFNGKVNGILDGIMAL